MCTYSLVEAHLWWDLRQDCLRGHPVPSRPRPPGHTAHAVGMHALLSMPAGPMQPTSSSLANSAGSVNQASPASPPPSHPRLGFNLSSARSCFSPTLHDWDIVEQVAQGAASIPPALSLREDHVPEDTGVGSTLASPTPVGSLAERFAAALNPAQPLEGEEESLWHGVRTPGPPRSGSRSRRRCVLLPLLQMGMLLCLSLVLLSRCCCCSLRCCCCYSSCFSCCYCWLLRAASCCLLLLVCP